LGPLRKSFTLPQKKELESSSPLDAPLVLLLPSLSAGSGCGWFSTKHTKKNFISKCKNRNIHVDPENRNKDR